METAAVGGASAGAEGGGGIVNWSDLPESVQQKFLLDYFAASDPLHQQLTNQAFAATQG